MKRWPALAALSAVLCLPGLSQANSELLTIVYPTGEFPADVQNLQAAIDRGGTVLLKATDADGAFTPFNFGPAEATPGGRAVVLTTDVELRGETVSGHMTTIQGGYMPVRGVSVPVNAAVRGIQFEGPMFAAIYIAVSDGIEITGNVIRGVVGHPVAHEARAVLMASGPSQVTGRIVVASNLISTDPERAAGLAYGVTILGADADVSIVRNIITDAYAEAVTVLGTGRVDVQANLVVPGAPGAGNPHTPAGDGVVVRTSLEGGAHIRDNVVVCANPHADGIYFRGTPNLQGEPVEVSRGVIENNTVVMRGSHFGGISLYGLVRGSRISGNRISGDGAYALQVTFYGDPAAIARSNRFLGNRISDFTSSVADVFFNVNAIDNLLVGKCDSVLDLGAGNQYTCGHGSPAAAAGNPKGPAPREGDMAWFSAVGRE